MTKKITSKKFLRSLGDYALITLGSIIQALALILFMVPADLVSGGLVGISQIIISLGAVLFPLALINFIVARHFPPIPPTSPLHSQPIPIAGESVTMVEDTNELPTKKPSSRPAE